MNPPQVRRTALPVGALSVLIGAHQFLIHPLFVAAAWTRLYGFPKDLRLWVAFFVHDLGYFTRWCEEMDSPEGERHVELGARLMSAWFDRPPAGLPNKLTSSSLLLAVDGEITSVRSGTHMAELYWGKGQPGTVLNTWGQFSLLHSRFYAKRLHLPVSKLCAADKLSVAAEPWWLYLPRVIASGEVWEYVRNAARPSKYSGEPQHGTEFIDITDEELAARRLTPRTWRAIRVWHARMVTYLSAWAAEHQDGRADTWTPAQQIDPPGGT